MDGISEFLLMAFGFNAVALGLCHALVWILERCFGVSDDS